MSKKALKPWRRRTRRVMISPRRLAEAVDCDTSTIHRMCLSGRLRSVRVGGLRRIPVEAAEELFGVDLRFQDE